MWMSSIPCKELAISRCLAHGFTAITVFGLPVLGGIEGWSGSGRHPIKDTLHPVFLSTCFSGHGLEDFTWAYT